MAAAPSWKIDKSRYLGRVLVDFNEIWRGDVVRPSWPSPQLKNLKFRKSKVAAAAIFEKLKNHDISVAVGVISTKFGTVMQFDPFERANR